MALAGTAQSMTPLQQPDGSVEFIYTDVALHGQQVTLVDVKQVLRSLGVKQAEIATAVAPFNSGKTPHPSSISSYLNGNAQMPLAVQQAIESLITVSTAAAAGATSTPTSGHTPSFARTMASVPEGRVPSADDTTSSLVGPNGPPPKQGFPLDTAYQIVRMVRRANDAHELTATFSLRKALMWGRAYALLQQDGYSDADALSGAFHLAVEAKTVGEEQQFLKNAFQNVFAMESRVPAVKAKQAMKDGNRHPSAYLIEPIVQACIPLWLVGATGTGKSHETEALAARVGRTYHRIQGTGDMSVDDLLGGFSAKNGTTQFEHGPLPLAMKEGAVLNIDEITVIPSEVLFELQAVLEGKPLVIKKNRGEVVTAAPGFCVIACDNTVGLAESPEYIGTKPMNEAFRDRFLFVHFDYLPEAVEKAAIAQTLQAFAAAQGWATAAIPRLAH